MEDDQDGYLLVLPRELRLRLKGGPPVLTRGTSVDDDEDTKREKAEAMTNAFLAESFRGEDKIPCIFVNEKEALIKHYMQVCSSSSSVSRYTPRLTSSSPRASRTFKVLHYHGNQYGYEFQGKLYSARLEKLSTVVEAQHTAELNRSEVHNWGKIKGFLIVSSSVSCAPPPLSECFAHGGLSPATKVLGPLKTPLDRLKEANLTEEDITYARDRLVYHAENITRTRANIHGTKLSLSLQEVIHAPSFLYWDFKRNIYQYSSNRSFDQFIGGTMRMVAEAKEHHAKYAKYNTRYTGAQNPPPLLRSVSVSSLSSSSDASSPYPKESEENQHQHQLQLHVQPTGEEEQQQQQQQQKKVEEITHAVEEMTIPSAKDEKIDTSNPKDYTLDELRGFSREHLNKMLAYRISERDRASVRMLKIRQQEMIDYLNEAMAKPT